MGRAITDLELKSRIKEIKANIKRGDYPQKEISCGSGLALVVGKNRSTFRLQFIPNGQKAKVKKSIGEYPVISLAHAFKKANEIRATYTEVKKSPLFKDYWLTWIDYYKNTVTVKTVQKTQSYYNRQLCKFNEYRLDEIEPQLVLDVFNSLEGISDSNKHDAVCMLQQSLEYAQQSLHLIDLNKPLLSGLIKYNFKRPTKEHMLWIHAEELKTKFFEPLEHEQDKYKLFYLLCVFTGLRDGNINNLKWSDIDFSKKESKYGVITISKENMKESENGDYKQPLTAYTSILLKNWKEKEYGEGDIYVFSGIRDQNKPLKIDYFRETIRSKGMSKYMSLHGLRTTFSTFMGQVESEQGFNRDRIEEILAHKPKNISDVARIYNQCGYLPEKLEILTYWHKYLVENQLTNNYLELLQE
ncbi:tyrosine-type recombinase/integrase [Succinivibrio dextrinosolvens]|uniref:tyrosine-type recombinase/integrase n=1 Tax=Succinivibrio dextrinosolvens TaxID=83771 RepID=UPI0004E19D06|nr:tyrosine-type recombinase/integrase [Succinivibrio dextrinosolvens]